MKSRKTAAKRTGGSRSRSTRLARLGAGQNQPATRNAGLMKQRILRLAAAEFARKGYDGARVDEIVRRCRISKNLVYHYFDSKEALFVAVLEKAYGKLRKRQQSMGLEHNSSLEGIMKLVIDSFEHWGESKSFIAYLSSENFCGARHIRKSTFIRSAYAGLIESIRDLLQRGEQEGVFRPGVDPIQLYISISALAYHFFSNQDTFSVIFGKDFRSSEMLAERLKHVQDVVLGYLQAKPDQPRISARI